MDLISLLVTLLVLGVIFYLVYWLVGQIPMAPPFKTVVMAILGIIAVLVLIGLLFGGVSVPVVRWR